MPTTQKATVPPPRLVRLGVVQQALSVSRGKLANMIADGDLKVIRLGRSVRVPVEEIDRLVKEGT